MTQSRTFGELRLRDRAWILDAIEPHVAIRLKQIFPRIPKESAAPFRLARSLATDSDLLWFTGRYPLRMDDAVAAELASGKSDYLAQQSAMEAILLPDYKPDMLAGFNPGFAARDYQGQAIDLCYASNRLLLGDECGLGKTIVGAAFCLKPGVLPCAVVCQGHIQRQWIDRIQEFTTLRTHEIKTRQAYSLPEADVYVFRYTQLQGWVDLFSSAFFKSVIFDETQELRTGTKTSKGHAALHLASYAQWRLGLTATPIYGYGLEIWHVMQFIDAGVLGEYNDFVREWMGQGFKLKDPRALGTYMREQHAFLRRTKHDVGRELSPVNRIIDYVDYDQKAVDSTDDLCRALAIRATTGSYFERGQAIRELDMRLRLITGVAKARAVAAYVRILVEGGQPVLLCGWHHEVYDIWKEELKRFNPAWYTGRETPTEKRAALKDFLEGQTDLIIGSLRGLAGIDGLQARCSTIVFGELDWSPGIHHQLIERVDRDGQTEPVMALYLVVNDGSDPPIMEVLGIKASEATQVVDPMLDAAEVHTDQGKLHGLLRRYLERPVEILEAT